MDGRRIVDGIRKVIRLLEGRAPERAPSSGLAGSWTGPPSSGAGVGRANLARGLADARRELRLEEGARSPEARRRRVDR